jgi:hypothetical protein
MGAQTEPMLFLLLGWGESLKARGDDVSSTQPVANGAALAARPFRRVMT